MLKIYDSLSGEKRPFHKKDGESVSIYVCGPTVYDRAHLGHGRSAVAFDVIRRYLETFHRFSVNFVSNITDIDDKMIDRAQKEEISVSELAARLIPEYASDYAALKIKEATKKPRATEFIPEMIEILKRLEQGGFTYLLEDGLYFDVSKFSEYGKLSHQNLDELSAGARIEARGDKRNHQDFVLWKFKKEGEPFWDSPWGLGRPGWHIECSGMSMSLLGETIDIHGGGLDLKFPHHECELAQSEGVNQKKFVEFWMHNGYITVDSEKMSKSLNNFFTLKEIFEQFNPRVVRFFLISTHYRSPIEFSPNALEQAAQSLRKLDEFYLKHRNLEKDSSGAKSEADVALLDAFQKKMDEDFDTSGALTKIYEWMDSKDKTEVLATLNHLNEVLQIFPQDFELSEDQKKLLILRQEARTKKDWAESDRLRSLLEAEGIECMDAADGTIAKPKI